MKKTLFILIAFQIIFASVTYASEIPEGFTTYTIRPGDTLGTIAPSRSWDIIKRVNRFDEFNMQVGQKIMIPEDHTNIPDYSPVPRDMPDAQNDMRRIYIFLDQQYFGAYSYGKLEFWGPVSTAGSKHMTPIGTFSIKDKYEEYFSHAEETYGAPMPYAQRLTYSGIFMHHQALAGKPISHGCIRLLMSDAQRLFWWTEIGDLVTISLFLEIKTGTVSYETFPVFFLRFLQSHLRIDKYTPTIYLRQSDIPCPSANRLDYDTYLDSLPTGRQAPLRCAAVGMTCIFIILSSRPK